MAFSNNYLLNVDIKNTYSISTPTFRQGDNGTLRFKIFDDNKLFDLTGLTDAKVVCKLPSEKTFEGSGTLNDKGEIEYGLTPELEASEEGYVQVILSVYSGDSVVSVQPFNIYMYDNNLSRNTQDVDILKGLIQQVQDLIVQVDQALVDVKKAVTEVNDLKTELTDVIASEVQRELNEAQRIANELVRESNEQDRISNETERIQHEQDRQTQFQQNQTTINNLIPLVENVENKESWDISTQYKKNNIVEYNGSSFMALRDNIGKQPPILPIKSNLDWSLLAEKGINGTGAVSTVNEMNPDINGNVTINSSSVGAIPLTEKGVTNGVAKLNASGKVVDALGNEVEGKVTSVNTKIGDVVLSASDVGTYTTNQIDNKIDILSGKLDSHLDEILTSEQGIHKQIRYVDNKLQFKINGIWIDYKNGTQIPVGSVINFSAIAEDSKITLTWEDPLDTKIGDVVVAKWTGTKIIRKLGSYPQNINDGVVVVNSGVHNQYKDNGYVDSGLINDTTYYYSAFAYTDDTVSEKVDVQATPESVKIYGVKIDTLNSNPETAVTYTDNAVGFTSAKGNNGNFSYGSWQDKFPFNQIKPCVVKNGVVNYYLNPNDYTKKLDGGNADITSGNDGDVMVEFPKIYWKFETIGNDLYIKYSDKQVDSTYKCLAHTRGVSEKDKIYLSAYIGFSLSSKLRSLSGRTPTVNQNISQFRTLAKANGTGYDQSTYYQILMLQVLYIVMFKNRDSQTALGRGYVDGNSSSIATGGTNAKGMFYGETTGKLQNKFCGVEDFWGNVYYWVDGMFCDASRNILIGNDNYNDTGSGYTNYGQGAVSNLGGYIDKVQGGTEPGFIIKSGGGSATTYYADYGSLNASCLPRFGSDWSIASPAGAFLLQVSHSASSSNVNLSARLSLC